jgi:hypothetical protein
MDPATGIFIEAIAAAATSGGLSELHGSRTPFREPTQEVRG